MVGSRQAFTVDGSVVRITMRNFMTYKNETFWPGPNFNVAVGPNGSGKSSILTALCIALGGDITALNRQTDLTSVINNDSPFDTEAEVDVELHQNEGQNKKINVIISKKGEPLKWKCNGEKVSKSELLEITEKLQIQPDNMCQFLYQDTVRDFPTLNNQKIFYNTVKAVGDMSLIHTYDKLKGIQKDIEELEGQSETKSNTLHALEKKEKKLESDKKIYEERKKTEDRKKIIENSIKWERFKDLRKNVKQTRDKQRELQEKVKQFQVEEQPLCVFQERYQNRVDSSRSQIEQADKDYSALTSKVEEFDIAELEDELERLKENEKDLMQQERNRIQGKRTIQKEIQDLKNYIAINPLDPELDQKIAGLTSKRAKQEMNFQRQEQSLTEVETHHITLRKEVDRLEREQTSILDKKQAKLETLRRENADAYQGVLWLRENRNIFKAPVHDPIMLTLDVKDKSYARYVEIHIGRADLEGFVCEDPDDVNLLTKHLREKLHLRKINAFHSNPEPAGRFQHPVPSQEMAKYTFQDYLSNMYSAPEAVNAYLCKQKHLHQVPVFREENKFTGELKNRFQNFYIKDQKFNTRKSRYPPFEVSTGMEDIGGRKVIRLAAVVNQEEVARISSELAEKRKQLNMNNNRKSVLTKTIESVKEEIAKHNEQIMALRNKKKEFLNKQSELTMKEKTLLQLNEPRRDLNKEKEQIKVEKRKVVKKMSEQMFKMKTLIEDSNKKESERRIYHLAFQNIESENSESIQRLGNLRRERQAAEAELSEVETRWNTEKEQLQKLHSLARNATGVLSNETKYKPPESWQKMFDDLGSSDENVLAALVDECESTLSRLKNIPESTIQEIKRLKERLEDARRDKEKFEAEMANKKHEAKSLRRKWISGVERLCENINDKFSRMMAELGYAGQISLHQGDSEIDFSSYGIKIQVRFRAGQGQELQDLSKGTQSGGEKSVTTAVYMMALQELTQVPFRCVDEINQGMDEKNERAVWDMLLQVCETHKAQYFYMAPKFPYSLPFNEQVTMLICNNGGVMKKGSKDFRTKSFVEKAKKSHGRKR